MCVGTQRHMEHRGISQIFVWPEEGFSEVALCKYSNITRTPLAISVPLLFPLLTALLTGSHKFSSVVYIRAQKVRPGKGKTRWPVVDIIISGAKAQQPSNLQYITPPYLYLKPSLIWNEVVASRRGLGRLPSLGGCPSLLYD